jgi:hypothetical protein
MTRGLSTARQRALKLLERALSKADIPNSVVYQWRAEGFSDPWPAYDSDITMRVNGISSSSFSNDNVSVYANGSSDFGIVNGPQSLPGNESFGIALTTQYVRVADITSWIGVDDGNNRFLIQQDDDAENATAGNIGLDLIDSNDNQIRLSTQDTFNDGVPHSVIINKHLDDVSGVEIYVDDMLNAKPTATSFNSGFNHSNFNVERDLAFFARNNQGSIGANLEGHVGAFEFNSKPYSESERMDFAHRRPEIK